MLGLIVLPPSMHRRHSINILESQSFTEGEDSKNFNVKKVSFIGSHS